MQKRGGATTEAIDPVDTHFKIQGANENNSCPPVINEAINRI